MTSSPSVVDVMTATRQILMAHLEMAPVVLFEDRPLECWEGRPAAGISGEPGNLSLLADDAVVYLFEFMDEDGTLWLTVDSGVLRTDQSHMLMAAVGLALMTLGGRSATNPFKSLGVGEEVGAADLESWLTGHLRGPSLSASAER